MCREIVAAGRAKEDGIIPRTRIDASVFPSGSGVIIVPFAQLFIHRKTTSSHCSRNPTREKGLQTDEGSVCYRIPLFLEGLLLMLDGIEEAPGGEL